MIRPIAIGVLAAALVGCGPAAGSTPVVTPLPATASPDAEITPAAPTASPESIAGIPVCVEGKPYDAGPQVMTAEATLLGFPLAITMTDGWTGCGLHNKELGEPGGVMMIGTWVVVNVYGNPCQWRTSLPATPAGPTVDDLMKALIDQESTDATAPVDVAIDGYAGKYLRLSVPADLDTTTCDKDKITEFRFLNGPGDAVWWLGAAVAPGLIGDVWALDVQGTRVLVQAASFVDAGEARRDEMRQIVESIDFMP